MLKAISRFTYMRRVCKPRDNERLTWGEGNVILSGTLLACEIEHFLAIIDQEIERSFDFGLVLDREDVLTEKVAIVTAISSLTNPRLPSLLSWDETRTELGIRVYSLLGPLAEKYFSRLRGEGRVPNMYNCHVDSICNEVVRAIFDRSVDYGK